MTTKMKTFTRRSNCCKAAALFLGLTAACASGFETVNTQWTWAGWGGGGFFWSAAIDPSNAKVMYLGGDVNGICKSEDKGKSWRFINNGLHEYGVYSMAISKSNPKVLYVMTPNGMAKTVNGGEKWTPLTETLKAKQNLSTHRPGSVRAIAIDPTNPDVVYAGSAKGVVCKSMDGGASWKDVNYLSAIKTDDSGPKLKPASGEGFLWVTYKSPAGEWGHSGRIEKFLDANGKDWSAYKTLTGSFYAPVGAPEFKVSLVIQSGSGWTWQEGKPATSEAGKWVDVSFDLSAAKDLNSVKMMHYVIRANGAAFEGDLGIDAVKLQPSDGSAAVVVGEWNTAGANEGWRLTTAADAPFVKAMAPSLAPATPSQAPIASITVSETDHNTLYIAHRKLGVFKSTDGAATWTLLDTPKEAANISIFPKDSRLLYGAFGKSGIWRSADGGKTWKNCSATLPENCDAREVSVSAINPKIVHAIGNQGWGGFYFNSADGGETWTSKRKYTPDSVNNPTLPQDNHGGKDLSTTSNLATTPADPDLVFIVANWNNIMSTDGGKTWNETIKGADITCFHDLLIVNDHIFAVAMDEGLFTSANDGQTWTQLAPLAYQEGLSGHQWRVAAFQKDNGDYHIVSTVSAWRGSKEYPNQVLVSDDSGKTFKRATGLPDYLPKKNVMWGDGYARALAPDPKNPMTLYLGIDGDAEPAKGLSGGGVFKSTDGGYTWTQLPNQPGTRRMFYGIAVDPTDSKRIFWGGFGANGGVWRSEDGGESWENVNKQDAYLFNVEVAQDGTVYAGGNALWQSRDHGTTWKKISPTGIPGSVVGIACDPDNAKRIWFSAATWDGSSMGGVFRSDDGGKTWVDISGDIGYRKPLVIRYNAKTHELWAAGVAAFRTKQ